MPGVGQVIVSVLRQSEPSSSLAVLQRVWRTEQREEAPWLGKLLGPDNLWPPEDEILNNKYRVSQIKHPNV